MKTIFVFTGGGLAPALNPTLYGVVSACRAKGWRALGGLYGWASLLRNGRHISFDSVNIEVLRTVGGTILRSSRTNPLVVEDGIHQVKERLRELKADAVVAIGGDDTLGTAAKLFQAGVPIIGIPKTVDNDLAGTYYTPGFPSAAHYLSLLTAEIRQDAAYALSRIFVIESMGMKAGWLAASSIYGHADVIIPPEHSVRLQTVLEVLNERYTKNGNYAVVVVAQEARFDEAINGIAHHEIGEQYGHVRQNFICLKLKDKISTELGIGTKAIYPGNFLETGQPIALDRDLAVALGSHAVELIGEGTFGKMTCIVRPDPERIDLTVSDTALRSGTQENYRPFPDNFFDYSRFQPTPACLDYFEPLLGKYQTTDNQYSELIKMITSQVG